MGLPWALHIVYLDPSIFLSIYLIFSFFLSFTNIPLSSMLKTCRQKCIQPRYSEEDLAKGEMVCVDRCVAKFFRSNLVVGDYLRESGNGPDSLASFRSVAAQSAGSAGYVAKD